MTRLGGRALLEAEGVGAYEEDSRLALSLVTFTEHYDSHCPCWPLGSAGLPCGAVATAALSP